MPAALLGPVIGAGIGAVGSAISGNKAGSGAGQAQADLSQQRNDLAPYRDAGAPALSDQSDLLGLNGPDAATAAMGKFQQSPGYQWQLGQGLRAIDAGAASKGLLGSGATIKAEETYGSGLANQDFTNYYNRLMGISTLGENAATGGASTAQTGANLAQGAGNTQGSIYGNLAGNLGSTVNGLFNNPSVQSWLTGSGATPAPATYTNNPGMIWNPNNPVGTQSL